VAVHPNVDLEEHMIVVRFKMQSKPDTTEQLLAALKDVIAASRQ
jgi:hypothetical protein